MKLKKFDLLVNSILEKIAGFNTLYYPNKKTIRGTDMGMTQVDPGKTFPSSDSTLLLKFPSKIKIKKKSKR